MAAAEVVVVVVVALTCLSFRRCRWFFVVVCLDTSVSLLLKWDCGGVGGSSSSICLLPSCHNCEERRNQRDRLPPPSPLPLS